MTTAGVYRMRNLFPMKRGIVLFLFLTKSKDNVTIFLKLEFDRNLLILALNFQVGLPLWQQQ